MKKTILIFLLLIAFIDLNAQVKYYRTKHLNVGFGKVTDCINNSYMDFCVNGPLVGNDGVPVGGYVDNGTTVKNWTSPSDGGGNFAVENAFFGLSIDGQMRMISYYALDQVPIMNWKWCFQNGPVLVKNGMNVRGASQSKYARSGIGFKPDGTLTVIVSLDPITFYDFANLFIKDGCSNAIYLDGGPYVGCSDKKGSYGTMVKEATKLQFFNN